MTKLRYALNYLFNIITGLAVLLAVILILIIVVINYSPLREALLADMAPIIAKQFDYDLDVEEISSPSIETIKFSRLTLKKDNNLILKINDFSLQWEPYNLLTKELYIEAISAGAFEVFLENLEKNNKRERQEEEESKSFFKIKIDKINLENIAIFHPAINIKDKYDIKGNLRLFYDIHPLNANIEISNKKNNSYLKINSLGKDKVTNIKVNLFEEKNGTLGNLIKQHITQNINLELTGKITAEDDGYKINIVNLNTDYRNDNIKLSGVVSLQEDLINIDSAELDINNEVQKIEGKITQDNLDLNIKLNKFPLQILQGFIPEIEGSVSGSTNIKNNINDPLIYSDIIAKINYQNLVIEAKLKADISKAAINIQKAKLRLNQNIVNIKGEINWSQKTTDIILTASSLSVSDLKQINILQAYLMNLEGEFAATKIRATGFFTDPIIDISTSFEGKYNEADMQLKAVGKGSLREFAINNLELDLYKFGNIKVKGIYSPENLDLNLNINNFNSAILKNINIDAITAGNLNADIAIKGSFSNPALRGGATFVAAENKDRKIELPKIEMTINQVEKNSIINLKFLRNNAQVGVINMSIPLADYLNYNRSGNLPLAGSLEVDFNLKNIGRFINLSRHKLAGEVKAVIKLGGDVKHPVLNGSIDIIDGFYQNIIAGINLNNINLNAKLIENRAIIDAKADTPENGAVLLKGEISNKTLLENIDIEISFYKAALIRSYAVDADINGKLNITGNIEKVLIEGEADLKPVNVRIDSLFNNNIATIKVNEVNTRNQLEKNRLNSEEEKTNLPEIYFDILLNVNKQAYLRGKGIDTELEGKINIAGNLKNMSYKGNFSVVRGTYEILGKKFALTEANIWFDQNSIFFQVSADYRKNGTEIKADISGNMDKMDINFSSSPPLPQDEIIAYLLFDKSAKNITPFQAIKLANAISRLRNKGPGVISDPLDVTRDLLGVDNIYVESETTETGDNISVGVGKYVSDKVYIELGRSNNPSAPFKGKIEVEILPNLNLETTTGDASTLGGVELKWKRDY